MPTSHRLRDDSIAIGDIIANIPPDEFRELVAAGQLESYVEERLEEAADEDDVVTAHVTFDEHDTATAEAVRNARDAVRDTRDDGGWDDYERDVAAAGSGNDDSAERDYSDEDGS